MPEYKDLDDMTLEKMNDSMAGKRDPKSVYPDMTNVPRMKDTSFLSGRTYFGDKAEDSNDSDDNSDGD